MTNENVDPIIRKYFNQYYLDLKKEYDNSNDKSMADLGSDLVNSLVKKCVLYRGMTLRITIQSN